jgi:drug/metabolite transporter (DMT)-like permease
MNQNSLGFLLAFTCAVTNVVMDILQKKALAGKPLFPTILCSRFVVLSTLTVIVLVRACGGHAVPWQTQNAQHMLHIPYFVPMLALDCFLVAASALLYYRALQIAPLSLTIPFLAFTPAFLLLTSDLLLREDPSIQQIEGVFIVIFGSVLMYRSQFRIGWVEPFRALGREPGSRYMLLAALIMSLTNSLDKWLIVRSNSYDFAWLYAVGSCILFSLAFTVRLPRLDVSFRGLSWLAILGAGIADATTLALQFGAMLRLRAVVVVSIKRSGILLSVLAGWYFFHERQIRNRILAAAIMLTGAVMLYFSFSLLQQSLLSAAMIALGLAGPSLERMVSPPEEPHPKQRTD